MPAVTRLERLLVALPSIRLGGTERHTLDLAGRIAARTGMAVTLLADPGLAPTLRALLPDGVALAEAAIGWEGDGPAATRAARQSAALGTALPALRPDAALLPLPWPDAATGLLPALAGLPRLVLLHLAPHDPPVLPQSGLVGAVLAAVSAPVARRAAACWGVAPGAVGVLPNPAPAPSPIDRAVARATLRSGLGLPAEAPLLLFVGRLEEAKGADLLPELSARLPMTLACAGDGPLRGWLAAAAAGDPRGLLRVLGPVADPALLYRAADALVMPSRLEGAPLVFLEAAANRCPVVASPAALEALGAEAPALACIAEGMDPRDLAMATRRLLDDPARGAERVEAAAAHAARLTWDRAVDGALGLLRAAVMGSLP